MAQTHNELRRQTEILRAIKDALAITDPEVNVERLGETLTPIIDIWSLPEWAFLRSEVLLADTIQQGAIVGEISAVGLVNPASSLYVLTIEAMRVTVAAGNVQYGYGLAATLLATLTSGVCFNRDPRNGQVNVAATPGQGATTPILFVNGSDPTIPGLTTTTLEEDQVAANVATDGMVFPVIVPPGVGFVALCTTANTAIRATVRAHARPSYAAEQ